jgi:hypothetical protein
MSVLLLINYLSKQLVFTTQMNNLSGFTDVINGIRQAIFTLNTQVVQLKAQFEQLMNKDTQNTSSLNDIEDLKSTFAQFKVVAENHQTQLDLSLIHI